ncbi:MAG: hypothetical protein GXP62_21990, partial [Oligoflexia bacterium]|nr:hypothetical protein [Oligoflexia bacterium]
MSTYWAHFSGDTSRLGFRVELERDPHGGVGATADEAASWGKFELWVDGINLCEHLEGPNRVGAVHWYLLELLEWFVGNWDAMLHEERLPARVEAPSAWESLKKTRFPPPLYSDDAQSGWYTEWQEWWKSHCIQDARFGGLFPEVFLRRWRDDIEVSWGQSAIAGARGDVHFLAGEGVARFDAVEAADVLFDVVDATTVRIAEEVPGSERLRVLRDQLGCLRTPARHWARVGFLAGVARRVDIGVGGLHQLRDAVAQAWEAGADAIFGVPEESLVVAGACRAGLMFGSMSPAVGEGDLLLLASEMARAYSAEEPCANYTELREERPPPAKLSQAWEDGYELAEDLREALLERGVLDGDSVFVDVEAVLNALGIVQKKISLSDKGVRAVAFCGHGHSPTVLCNQRYSGSQKAEIHRFTLAHELCHVLYDASRASELAIASGPWA